jgi:hypothetical protein
MPAGASGSSSTPAPPSNLRETLNQESRALPAFSSGWIRRNTVNQKLVVDKNVDKLVISLLSSFL